MLKVRNLKIEYLSNPIGIDRKEPSISYTLEGDSCFQSAYRLVFARDEVFSDIAYDTGKVASSGMTGIRYRGPLLKSRERIYVRCKVWDENDIESEWSDIAFFEMGLLNPSDWKAKWITGDYTPKKNIRYPVDCFKKEFTAARAVKRARLYITACGLYEARLNGRRVGDFCLAPGWTDYRRRIQYQTYDVTDMLQSENALEVWLADGWWRGSIGAFGPTHVYGRQTKLLCQLEIQYIDETIETIVSDETFSWSNDGPIRFADLKDGEVFDASMTPSYRGKARIVKEKITLSASNNVPVRMQESFPAKLFITPAGKKMLDFGQNIAGFVAFKVRGEKGQKLCMRFGETLDANGELTQTNFQLLKPVNEWGTVTAFLLVSGKLNLIKGEKAPTPKQELEFICSGGEDSYCMRFAVFGFRYAEIETDVDIDPTHFNAIAVYSDMEPTGDFICSNPKVNRFVENTRWSMKGNFLDVPTDCPTRERLGWTGDAQIFFNTAAYFMDVRAFFRKWLLDLEDAQLPDGKLPAVAPYAGIDFMYNNAGGSVGWSDAAVLIPYRYWKRYGDKSILSDFYGMMRKYALFMIKNTGHKKKKDAKANPYNRYVYEKGVHLGEWLEPEEFRDPDLRSGISHVEECTAYLHYTMAHMTEIAEVLGKSEDAALFAEYAEGAKRAYHWLFLRNGAPDTDRQAKLVRPLALGLVDGEMKEAVQKRLIRAVANYRHRVNTGFLSTPFLLPVLTEAGRMDLAYQLLENEEAPGWLAEVNAGATTVWEDWDGKASHNHYAPGSVCEWLFDTVAGIRIASENRFTIAPHPGGTLTHAKAHYESVYGRVSVEWRLQDGRFFLTIIIPCNTTATIILPNNKQYTVNRGMHVYETEWNV
ncbi:MAG: glycoside hydrolase family 78 protein [Caldilinea sp.]|nr:glycoside hydrolase family 78 protein [Caldilinea sp.]MDW8440990.1 family 78 glycoside hydrolase catalytic domain [Caldilineaceae bacterium]